jgi:hypothetical protein
MTTAGTPGGVDMVELILRLVQGRIHTALVARVETFEEDTRLADVQPLVKGRTREGAHVERAPLYAVPCPALAWGDWLIAAPYQKGDHVLVLVLERSHEEWRDGQVGTLEPSDERRHDLRDAFVLMRVDADGAIPSAPALQSGALTLSRRDGSVQVVLSPGGVQLGDHTAADAVALAPEVLAQLQAVAATLGPIVTWYNLGVAAANTAGSPVPATFAPGSVGPTYSAALAGATKVKGV